MKEIKKGIIYLAKNDLTGEVYIGATGKDLKTRKLDHEQRALRGDSNDFQSAISTYGANSFSWEQIDTAYSLNDLADKEKTYIIEYSSKENGYNQDSGGGFSKKVYQYTYEGNLVDEFENLESAANAVNANKSSISSACLNINRTCKGYYWSYSYTDPFIPLKDKRRKKVIQMSLDGVLIDEYKSVAEASRITGVSKTCISRVCRDERKQSGGFVWEYS